MRMNLREELLRLACVGIALLAALITLTACGADSKVSDLTETTTLDDRDLFLVSHFMTPTSTDSVSRKITKANLVTGRSASLSGAPADNQVVTATPTVIRFGVVDWDTGTMSPTTNVLVITKAGKYMVGANLGLVGGDASGKLDLQIEIYRGGSFLSVAAFVQITLSGDGSAYAPPISGLVNLALNDVVKVTVNHTGGDATIGYSRRFWAIHLGN